MSRSVVALCSIFILFPASAADNRIDDLSANELIKAKDQIDECRGLQSPTSSIQDSSVGDCVQFFIRRGDLAEYRDDLYSAVILFGEAIHVNNRPSYTEAYDRRGNALIGQGRLKEAITDFDTAISREPSDSRAFGYRGKAYFLNNENDRALADLDRAIALDRANAAALVTRGDLFRRLGAPEKARADFEAAINLPWKDRERRIAQETANRRLAALGPQPQAEIAKAKDIPSAVAPTMAAAPHRVALVVGNSGYRYVPMLPNPQRDAAAVANVLRKIGFDVILLTNLGRSQMSSALQDFAKLAENSDWAVVYFAGHGMEVGGVNYLVPTDAKIASDRDIGFEAVPLEQVLNVAERAKKLRLIILDACRDNPFANQMKRTQTVASRSVTRGLVAVEPEAGTLVVYAAKDGETASDGDGTNSPFTSAFIKNVQTPGLEVRRLFDFVRDDVMDATQRKQKPFSYGSISGRQDFYFVAAK
ncbi:tetratricopeptide (TPR) repeat protein [Bradyrhizobium sp. LB9.1b]